MWPYPDADAAWIEYFEQAKSLDFEPAADASLCTVLEFAPVRAAVRGLVLYDGSSLDALQWVAATAAGLYDSVPVTTAMKNTHPCLGRLPVLYEIPTAATFRSDLGVYRWAMSELLPNASTKVLLVTGCFFNSLRLDPRSPVSTRLIQP